MNGNAVDQLSQIVAELKAWSEQVERGQLVKWHLKIPVVRAIKEILSAFESDSDATLDARLYAARLVIDAMPPESRIALITTVLNHISCNGDTLSAAAKEPSAPVVAAAGAAYSEPLSVPVTSSVMDELESLKVSAPKDYVEVMVKIAGMEGRNTDDIIDEITKTTPPVSDTGYLIPVDHLEPKASVEPEPTFYEKLSSPAQKVFTPENLKVLLRNSEFTADYKSVAERWNQISADKPLKNALDNMDAELRDIPSRKNKIADIANENYKRLDAKETIGNQFVKGVYQYAATGERQEFPKVSAEAKQRVGSWFDKFCGAIKSAFTGFTSKFDKIASQFNNASVFQNHQSSDQAPVPAPSV